MLPNIINAYRFKAVTPSPSRGSYQSLEDSYRSLNGSYQSLGCSYRVMDRSCQVIRRSYRAICPDCRGPYHMVADGRVNVNIKLL